MAKKAPTLGDLIDKLAKIKAEVEVANNELKAVKEREDKAKKEILEMMDAQGKLTRAAGKAAQVILREQVLPQVVDWDKLYGFIYEKRYLHLLQRRVSVPGFTELFETLGDVPGVEKFTKRDVTLRSL